MRIGRRIFLALLGAAANAAGIFRDGSDVHAAGAEPVIFEDHGRVRVEVPGKRL